MDSFSGNTNKFYQFFYFKFVFVFSYNDCFAFVTTHYQKKFNKIYIQAVKLTVDNVFNNLIALDIANIRIKKLGLATLNMTV